VSPDTVPLEAYNAVVSPMRPERKWKKTCDPPRRWGWGAGTSLQDIRRLIRTCLQKRNWRQALSILTTMKECGVPPNLLTYSSVVSACAKSDQTGPVLELFERICATGVSPNIITYNSVMSTWAGSARWRNALDLLNRIGTDLGVEPDTITYTCAMRACAKGRRTARPLTLLEVVRAKGLWLDV